MSDWWAAECGCGFSDLVVVGFGILGFAICVWWWFSFVVLLLYVFCCFALSWDLLFWFVVDCILGLGFCACGDDLVCY